MGDYFFRLATLLRSGFFAFEGTFRAVLVLRGLALAFGLALSRWAFGLRAGFLAVGFSGFMAMRLGVFLTEGLGGFASRTVADGAGVSAGAWASSLHP